MAKVAREQDHHGYWKELASKMAQGTAKLSMNDMVAIAEYFDFRKMNPDYYPKKELANSIKLRADEVDKLTFNLWGLSRKYWLGREQCWLEEARKVSGITEDDSKDKPGDVVSLDILVRIFTLAYLFYNTEELVVSNPELALTIRTKALRVVNDFIGGAVQKGQLRIDRVPNPSGNGTISMYTYLKNAGLPAGPSGKYLPFPEHMLFELYAWLHKDSLNEKVYIK